jgi:hypothetical protein
MLNFFPHNLGMNEVDSGHSFCISLLLLMSSRVYNMTIQTEQSEQTVFGKSNKNSAVFRQ